MKKTLFTTLFLLGVVQAAFATEYAGVVAVGSAEARPGDTCTIDISISGGDVNLSGLTIPLNFGTNLLTVDSVSFAGSVAPAGMKGVTLIDNPNHKVRISFFPDYNIIPLQTIPMSGGHLARVYFSLSASAQPGDIVIDTVYLRDSVLTGSTYVYYETETLNAADAQATGSLYPDFVAGLVSVQVPTAAGDDDRPGLPGSFHLAQNYPNPFNPSTQISFTLPQRGKVQLDIFNVLGQRVTTLVNEVMAAGDHTVTFDATSNPSGIYFYRLISDSGTKTRKMVFLK